MHPEDTEAYLRIFKCGPSFYADGFTNWGTAVEFALKNADAYKEARHKQFFYIFKARDRDAAKRIKTELESFGSS
jgi:hypothetical protein